MSERRGWTESEGTKKTAEGVRKAGVDGERGHKADDIRQETFSNKDSTTLIGLTFNKGNFEDERVGLLIITIEHSNG